MPILAQRRRNEDGVAESAATKLGGHEAAEVMNVLPLFVLLARPLEQSP